MKEGTPLTKEIKLEAWGDGPWVDEPDVETFEHAGLECLVRRICALEGRENEHLFGGHLCGYVKLPEGIELTEDGEEDIDVHGGITFNDVVDEDHWIGFDCAHAWDIMPSSRKFYEMEYIKELLNSIPLPERFESEYRNWEFAKSETKKLAEQVKAICLEKDLGKTVLNALQENYGQPKQIEATHE